MGEARKQFFFAKENQKTPSIVHRTAPAVTPGDEVFLLLCFQTKKTSLP
jgi:hypothetical protein